VATTQDPAVSQLTLVMHGADDTVEQIIKQTRKLVDVIDVSHPVATP
jgi:acetolactate synthase-1/3 small subunit